MPHPTITLCGEPAFFGCTVTLRDGEGGAIRLIFATQQQLDSFLRHYYAVVRGKSGQTVTVTFAHVHRIPSPSDLDDDPVLYSVGNVIE